jgi:hypothetical protein
MRVFSILFTVMVMILVISLICIWFYPSKQDFMASNTMWDGIKNFSSEFHTENIDSLGELPSLPEGAVLVAVPYLDYSGEELEEIKRFVANGGTLLLMDDYGYGNSILMYLGVAVRFTHKPLVDPVFCYQNQYLPRITDFAPGLKKSNINSIMLNHACTLTDVPASEVIASSSGSSFLDMNDSGVWDQDEPKGPFVVAARFRLGKGILALVADPSIIINAMVGRDDNQKFIKYMTYYGSEQKPMLVDHSRLPQTPLDVSKTRLVNTRKVLSSPYALLGVTATILVVVSIYLLRREKPVGQH